MTTEIDRYGLEPKDGEGAWQLARVAAASGMYGVQKPEQALVIIMTGRELGLSASQALRGIQVVKGKPNISADLLVALVRRSELCESWFVAESSPESCTIETKRRGDQAPRRLTWTMADAKRAGISGEMYTKYPRQMLRHGCAADLAREVYPDLCFGLYAPEEFDDPRDLPGIGDGVPDRGRALGLPPEPVSVDVSPSKAPAPASAAAIVEEPEAAPIPPAIQRVRDSLAQFGGPLLAAQAAAVWSDHYDELPEALRDRAWEMIELSLADQQKTAFKSLAQAHEARVAAKKRAAIAPAAPAAGTLEHDRSRIRAAATVAELEAVKASLSKETIGALIETLWLRRIALCASLGDLKKLDFGVRSIRSASLRGMVERALSTRWTELSPPGPGDDGGGEPAPSSGTPADEDPEREAIAGEPAGSPLSVAVARLHGCNGPSHAVSHYLAHRDELEGSARVAYREALVTHLAHRYPRAVPSLDAAKQLVAETESISARRAA